MTPKKIPVRRCVGCGEGKPKKVLLRLVRTAEGEISLDLTGRKAGREAQMTAVPSRASRVEGEAA